MSGGNDDNDWQQGDNDNDDDTEGRRRTMYAQYAAGKFPRVVSKVCKHSLDQFMLHMKRFASFHSVLAWDDSFGG